MLIRPAAASDAGAILSILLPVVRAGTTYALDRTMAGDDLLSFWMGGDHEVFVAEAGGVLVGTYYLHPNQRGGGRHVANCGYVTKESARGGGVATAMCRHSLAAAKERGFRAMQFNFVVASNRGAIRLWQQLGFAVVGRLPGAFCHPDDGFVDALVMFRAL